MNCKTILVVEDDNDIRESIKDFLELEDYMVMTAANGKQALEILDTEEKPCLVLLDMMMPIMGGREFLDIVSKNVTISPLPVFILSAVAAPDNTTGAIGFMRKPADLEVILSIVKGHCN